jgi:hypothetical protein
LLAMFSGISMRKVHSQCDGCWKDVDLKMSNTQLQRSKFASHFVSVARLQVFLAMRCIDRQHLAHRTHRMPVWNVVWLWAPKLRANSSVDAVLHRNDCACDLERLP